MPRKKISLDEAYAVFERHNLRVEITGIAKPVEPLVAQQDLFESTPKVAAHAAASRRVGKTMVRIMLRTKQTITSGGEIIRDAQGKVQHIAGQQTVTYGPGVAIVPAEIAGDLQYQDMLAVQADDNFLSREFKSYVVLDAGDGRHVAKLASTDTSFDMSGFLGRLGETGSAIRLPF